MEIRKLENKDIKLVVQLWYETSARAHDFIPLEYWGKNKAAMENKYLPNSDTYLALEENQIIGFVAMVDNYLAAIFVWNAQQGKGTGKGLMNYVKETRDTIQLKVYKKNIDAIEFYKKQGFKILSENIEENTNEAEFMMEWNR